MNVTAFGVLKLLLDVKYLALCKLSGIYLIMAIFGFLLFFLLEKYLKGKKEKYVASTHSRLALGVCQQPWCGTDNPSC